MHNSIYSFENEGKRKFADKQVEDDALKEIAQRLGFNQINYEENRELLLNFIINLHKVIIRYNELRKKEMKRRLLFTFFSLILLCIIPYVIFTIPSNDSNYVTQITILLTGLIAVHKSLSSWLDTRKIIGNFWRAESDLKSKLYAFEDKWKGQTAEIVVENGSKINKLKENFLKDISVIILEAKVIVQNEQNQFFETITYPSIDLLGTLKTVKTDVNHLVSDSYESITDGSASASENLFKQRKTWGTNAKG